MSGDTIRVLIVDDHPSVREGLTEMISAQADMVVAGAAADGEEAVALQRLLLPDVTIMDLRLPKMSGIEAIQAIRRDSPQAKIIVMTAFQGELSAAQAIGAGASAYLLKEMFGEELLATIRAVADGRHRGLSHGMNAPNQS